MTSLRYNLLTRLQEIQLQTERKNKTALRKNKTRQVIRTGKSLAYEVCIECCRRENMPQAVLLG